MLAAGSDGGRLNALGIKHGSPAQCFPHHQSGSTAVQHSVPVQAAYPSRAEQRNVVQ